MPSKPTANAPWCSSRSLLSACDPVCKNCIMEKLSLVLPVQGETHFFLLFFFPESLLHGSHRTLLTLGHQLCGEFSREEAIPSLLSTVPPSERPIQPDSGTECPIQPNSGTERPIQPNSGAAYQEAHRIARVEGLRL